MIENEPPLNILDNQDTKFLGWYDLTADEVTDIAYIENRTRDNIAKVLAKKSIFK